MKIEYKDTPIGKIPKDWEVVKLGDIAKEMYRYPTYYNIQYSDKGIPEIRGDLLKSNGELEKDPMKYRYISPETSKRFPRTTVREGDFIMSVRGTMGKVAVVPKSLDGANITANLMRISLDHSKCYSEFFRQFFLSEKFQTTLNFLSSQTTIKTIQAPILKSIRIPLPSLKEQQKIAEILSNVDETIHEVDEAIKEIERIKEGLMRELLKKGIGHKKFKDTKIGKIPKEWHVVELGDLIRNVKNGFASGKRDENGIVQVRMNNVTTDGRLILESYLKVPVPERVKDWILKRDDFLFNNTNSIDLVGKSTIFKEAPFSCTFSNHFTRIRFKKISVIPELVLYHFIMLWKKGFFKSVAIRHVGQAAVHSKYLVKIKLPLPPIQEQKKIDEILSTVDKKLELEKERSAKLLKIKKGLMNDLLTGKVRVKVN